MRRRSGGSGWKKHDRGRTELQKLNKRNFIVREVSSKKYKE